MFPNVYKPVFVVFYLLFFNIVAAQVLVDVEQTDKDSATISLGQEPVDSTGQPKERLEDIVNYVSEDQIHEREKRYSYLLRKAIVDYGDMHLEADYIEINWETGDVYAEGKKDSLGLFIEPTKFKQGNQEFEQNAFKFNFNTQKGTAYNVRFDDDDGSAMLAEKVYRQNDSVSLATGLKYTTDTYFKERKTEDPDYYISAGEGKILDQGDSKTVIARDINLKIHDVPTPLVLPFIYLPLSNQRKAGILIPSFGEREEIGFFLQGLGFYLPLGDYVDLIVTGDIYTRGSWAIRAQSTYRKNYRFNGRLQFDYDRLFQGTRGLSDFSEQTLFRLNWTHTQDPKANPNLVFSASVNYSSSQFFQNTINNNNVFNQGFLTNNVNSTISVQKTFDDSPFSMSLTSSLSQNNRAQSNDPVQIQLTLPDLTVNMARIYPFSGKSGNRDGLIRNLNVNYNFNFRNFANTNEDELFTSEMWNNAQNGARHQFNFNTGVTIANYFPVNFSANYEEVWYLETTEIDDFNAEAGEAVEREVNGFDSFRTFGVSVNTQTNLYGTFISKKEDALIKGIRHVMNPTIGFSFRPDFANEFWGYYDFYRDEDGTRVLFNRFQDGIFGGPSQGLNTSLNFSLNNNLEMKVRDRTDSTGYKKVKIFEFLNFTSSYNFAADSLRFSPVNMTGRTSLFQNKLGINFGARFNPYRVVFQDGQTTGTRIDEFGGFQVDSYNIAMTYNFTNETFGEKLDTEQYKKRGAVRQEDYYFDEDNYAKFNIPWNINLGINHTYNLGTSREATRQLSARIGASVQPTPHWSISTNFNYDFENQEFSATNFNFTRDLRSFNLTFSWQPFGQFRTWNFFINIKSSILADALKYEEQSSNELRGLFNN